jgi:imidazolonepropionase-like amidohydrolase
MIVATILIMATLACALVAGFLLAFAIVVMPGLRRLDDAGYIEAFRAIDRVIQNGQPLFVLLWVGSLVLIIAAAGMGWRHLDGPWQLVVTGAAVVYLLGVHVPTLMVNVPLNNRLQALRSTGSGANENRAARMAFEDRWNRWNVVRTVVAVLVSLLLIVTLSSAAMADTVRGDLLITGVTVVSSHLDEPDPDRNVLIRDGRIVSITAASEPRTAGVPVLEGAGLYLTPGLMDSHVHVSLLPGLGFTGTPRSSAHPELVAAYLEQQPRSYLYHGVTQIIDPNPGLSWSAFVDAPLRPDAWRCAVITAPGTYPFVEYDETTSRRLFPYLVNDEEGTSPEDVVERIAATDAVGIKLYFEDGFGDQSQWPLLDDDTVGRIRDAAHARGLLVFAHANAWDMYAVALRNRVDIMAHGLWNWGPDNQSDGVPAGIARMLDTIIERGTGYQPTTQVMAGLGALMDPAILADPAVARTIPASYLAYLQTQEGQHFRDVIVEDFGGLEPAVIRRIVGRILSRGDRALRHVHDAGHPLLLASDCPGNPGHANQPGLTTYHEMLALASAGLTPPEIMAAGTVNNARRFGLADDYGTVETGKVANLLLLSENPLASVSAWDTIETVVLHGKARARESLRPR